MSHKMHTCNTEGGKAWIASAQHLHNWPYADKVALNVDYSKRKEGPLHDTCPWGCGTDPKTWEDVPVYDAQSLGVNTRASGFGKAPQSVTKAQNAELSQALRTLTELVTKQQKQIDELSKGGKKQ